MNRIEFDERRGVPKDIRTSLPQEIRELQGVIQRIADGEIHSLTPEEKGYLALDEELRLWIDPLNEALRYLVGRSNWQEIFNLTRGPIDPDEIETAEAAAELARTVLKLQADVQNIARLFEELALPEVDQPQAGSGSS